MGHFANSTPRPSSHSHPRFSPQNWTRPRPLVASRGPSGIKLNHRTNSFHLTKTCTLCTYSPTPPVRLYPSSNSRGCIHPRWRLRGPQPDPVTKDPSLLLDCPSWLNNARCTICSFPNPSSPPDIFCYNVLCLYCLQTKQLHNH